MSDTVRLNVLWVYAGRTGTLLVCTGIVQGLPSQLVVHSRSPTLSARSFVVHGEGGGPEGVTGVIPVAKYP